MAWSLFAAVDERSLAIGKKIKTIQYCRAQRSFTVDPT
jgi:hypothetical protein